MNIKDITPEECLAFGSVHIAAIKGLLFKATFRGPNVNYVSVESDRGLMHLLLLVVSVVSADAEIKKLADETYKYPLTISSPCDLERSLRHEYLEIFRMFDEDRVIVRLRSVSGRYGIPGLFLREASSVTLLEAIAKALAIEHPVRFIPPIIL